MLAIVITVLFSIILVVLSNQSVRRPGLWTVGFFVCGVFFSTILLRDTCFLPSLMIFIFLVAVRWPEASSTRRRWLSPPFSIMIVSIITLCIASVPVIAWQRELALLREMYPYESMEARLPLQPSIPREPLPEATLQRLNELEKSYSRNPGRVLHLHRLHDEKVSLFLDTPGFGSERIIRPSERGLEYKRLKYPLPQPGLRLSPRFPLREMDQTEDSEKELYRLHLQGFTDFLAPAGFGFIKDRQHVSGFQPHGFEQVPDPAGEWEVRTLDLIGLLIHENPVGYVSDELPRMDKLLRAPTRPLVEFETNSLEKLRNGEDLVIEGTTDTIRMLGSLRSTKQCLQCHGGNRGDLLGAFSYTLQQTGK